MRTTGTNMTHESNPGFFRKRVHGLQQRWQFLAGSEYDEAAAALRPELPPEDRSRVLERMRQCLDARGGEIQARSRAAALGEAYLALNTEGREVFLRMLAQEFDFKEGEVSQALDTLTSSDGPEGHREARRALMEAVESPRVRILKRFNALPQGVKFLVDLRADLIPLARKDPVLASLDDDLKGLLTAWFDPGFLQLRRISWDTASGALLEKFMAYEAVHPVESWEDLKGRLDLDRRYFAYFHPRMPDEPLVFLEVALVERLATNIQDLLDPFAAALNPSEADTAIFYAISNAQRGLVGISFGGFLIKQVVDELAQEFPGLRTFASLSPLPGFLPWLKESECPLLPSEVEKLKPLMGGRPLCDWLADILTGVEWFQDNERERTLRPILLRLAAYYLTKAKRPEGGAVDPVANFHLRNGARLERLNWAADLSERGLAQYAGIMANYLYDARKIESNHEAYQTRGRVMSSKAVKGLLKA
jgi:malonyl-CoA decarboxylase